MDQFTGGGGNGGFGAPQAAPVYAPLQAPPRRKKLWPWIAGGAALAAVLVTALTLWVFPARPGAADPPTEPVLFFEDGEVYLAAGDTAIRLDGASVVENYDNQDVLNGALSYDHKTLYYMADASGSSGEGDLMRIALWDEDAKPECVAEDVYSAEISNDGNRILYVTDGEDYEYELYVCTPGGEPERIARSVSAYNFGFSPNGKHIYYATTDSIIQQELMIYSDGGESEVADLDMASLGFIFLDDHGRMLYTLYEDSKDNLYLYEDGDSDRVARDVNVFAYVFGRADEFVYDTDDKELHYYLQGDEGLITDEYVWVRFISTNGIFDRYHAGKHFLFEEGEWGDSTLFEITVPGDPIEIGRTDGYYAVDTSFRYVAYAWKDSLYLSQKSGSGWDDRGEICENLVQSSFDTGGNYLYYIAAGEKDGYTGELCRMALPSGRQETLLDDVSTFQLSDGQVYALTEDGEVYRISDGGDAERIEQDATAIYRAEGGVYVLSESSELIYCSSGGSERLAGGVQMTDYLGYLTSED